MSAFVGLEPAIRIRISNLGLGAVYPSSGVVEAVVDTGYEGFLMVPRRIFEVLKLHEMMVQGRKIRVADGRTVESKVAYATVELEGTGREIDGAVETIDGLDEILAGIGLVSRFSLTLDYCLRVFSLRPCD